MRFFRIIKTLRFFKHKDKKTLLSNQIIRVKLISTLTYQNHTVKLCQNTYIAQTTKRLCRNIQVTIQSLVFHQAPDTLTLQRIIFRDARQKQSVSCVLLHDVKPIRGDHSLLPFSRGSRACSLFFCCAAEMFFSLLYYFLCYIIYTFGVQNYLFISK